jgi:hypothetical protein
MKATIDSNCKRLNKQGAELRRVMSEPNRFEESMRLFQTVHAQLHSARITDLNLWSFADAVLDDLNEAIFRCIPHHQEHSIAW